MNSVRENGKSMNPSEYTFSVEWCEEDQEYIGTVFEIPQLSWRDSDPHEAMRGIMTLFSTT